MFNRVKKAAATSIGGIFARTKSSSGANEVKSSTSISSSASLPPVSSADAFSLPTYAILLKNSVSNPHIQCLLVAGSDKNKMDFLKHLSTISDEEDKAIWDNNDLATDSDYQMTCSEDLEGISLSTPKSFPSVSKETLIEQEQMDDLSEMPSYYSEEGDRPLTPFGLDDRDSDTEEKQSDSKTTSTDPSSRYLAPELLTIMNRNYQFKNLNSLDLLTKASIQNTSIILFFGDDILSLDKIKSLISAEDRVIPIHGTHNDEEDSHTPAIIPDNELHQLCMNIVDSLASKSATLSHPKLNRLR